MSLGIILIYGCAFVIVIQKRAHLYTCITGSFRIQILRFSQFLELIVFPQVIIMSGKGDVDADEPEDKTMKVMCHLKNCWVSWAGE